MSGLNFGHGEVAQAQPVPAGDFIDDPSVRIVSPVNPPEESKETVTPEPLSAERAAVRVGLLAGSALRRQIRRGRSAPFLAGYLRSVYYKSE